MDKYEYKLKTEQMLELMEDGAYSRAAELADSIDWRRVRNTTMLMNVSDIYEKSRDYHKSFEVLKIAYHRAEGSRKIVYRLCTLALKTRNVDEAIDYYDEFLHIAPKDPNQYILKYQILKVQRAPIEQQIDALESFKKAEYVEEWAYELAKLYERAGKITECLEECDDLILWFSEGKYVYQAMELKMRYKPLTPSQQEKYNRRYEKPGTTTEELPDLNNVDENGVKVAAKSVTTTQEQTEEDAVKTEEKAESDKSAESEQDIKIPVVEETLANKFVDEDVVKAEVRAKAKAEILGEADSFEPTSIDSLTESIRKAAETETVEQEKLEEKEEQESEEIAEKTESSEDVKEQVLDPKADSVEVKTESEVEEKQPEKKKIGNTMRLDEALKALLHIGGSDSGSRESSDEEAEKKDDDLSDLNDAIEDIEDVVDLSLVQRVEQKRAQKKALEAVKDVKVDSDLEELSMKKLKSKPETTVNLDDTLPMNLDDTVEMSPEEIIAMYGGTEEAIKEEPEAEEIIEPEEEEIIEEEPEAKEVIEPEYAEEETIDEDEIFEVEQVLEAKYIEPEDEEEDQLDNQVTARMSLEELFAAWDEEDALAEAEEFEEPEAEEVIEEEPEAEEIIEPEEEEILEEEPEAEETEEISEEDILNLDSAEEWSDDELTDVFEENSDNKAESVEKIDEALNEAESVKDIKQAEPEKEETMSVERKTGEPILPPDIQRLIDEIEGVIPREDEEPMSESSTSASKMQERMPEDNMEQEMDMLRVDEYEDEYEDEYADEFPVEEEESLEAVQPQGGYTQEFERIMDDRFASFEAEEDYSDELGDLYPDMEDDISDEIDAIALEEEAFEQETEIDSPEYEDEEYSEEYDEYPEEEYEDEYEDDEYPEEEYEDEYEDDEYLEEEYEDEYEDDEYPEEEYEDEYEDEEYEYEDDEEYDAADAAAQFEAEFRPQSSNDEYDDRMIDDEDDDAGVNFLSKTAPLSRKETAKLIATGKTAPLPLDEISNALSISDTGFLVHNKHELLSESGKKKTELTADQKRLFSYFVPVRGMSEQLVDVLEQDKNCTNRRGTSRTGNLLIIGNKGNGKTVLAVDVVKAIQRQRNIHQGKVAIVTGESLNKKKIGEIFRKLYGGALIIEKAGKLNERTVAKLNKVMEQDTGELLIVLEDQRKPLDRLLSSNREFRKKFTSRLEVPIFINDELVTFGQTYAQENGYRIDEMGLLALYSRIDALQREDHFVTVAEVKEIMDEAMEHSKKASARKLVKRVFGKGTDEADRILLTEKDFHI